MPETSFAHTLAGGIADGYLTYRDGMLRIFTDQIGYEFGELELYENSRYEHGYFRFEMMDPDHTTFYTEVDCCSRLNDDDRYHKRGVTNGPPLSRLQPIEIT